MNKILIVALSLFIAIGGYFYYKIETGSPKNNAPSVQNQKYMGNIVRTATPKPTKFPTLTPTPIEPSKRALEASIRTFLLVSDIQRADILKTYSSNNDAREAIKNLALYLDSNRNLLNEVENILALSQASQPDSHAYANSSTNTQSYSNNYEYSYPPTDATNNGNNYKYDDYNYSSNNGINSETDWNYYSPSPTVYIPEDNNINIVGDSSSYTRIGNTNFGSEGDYYTQIGNTTFGSDGSTSTQIGNTTFGSDNSTYTKIGDTVFGNGEYYTQIGNTTFGSDGSTSTQIGNTTFIDR